MARAAAAARRVVEEKESEAAEIAQAAADEAAAARQARMDRQEHRAAQRAEQRRAKQAMKNEQTLARSVMTDQEVASALRGTPIITPTEFTNIIVTGDGDDMTNAYRRVLDLPPFERLGVVVHVCHWLASDWDVVMDPSIIERAHVLLLRLTGPVHTIAIYLIVTLATLHCRSDSAALRAEVDALNPHEPGFVSAPLDGESAHDTLEREGRLYSAARRRVRHQILDMESTRWSSFIQTVVRPMLRTLEGPLDRLDLFRAEEINESVQDFAEDRGWALSMWQFAATSAERADEWVNPISTGAIRSIAPDLNESIFTPGMRISLDTIVDRVREDLTRDRAAAGDEMSRVLGELGVNEDVVHIAASFIDEDRPVHVRPGRKRKVVKDGEEKEGDEEEEDEEEEEEDGGGKKPRVAGKMHVTAADGTRSISRQFYDPFKSSSSGRGNSTINVTVAVHRKHSGSQMHEVAERAFAKWKLENPSYTEV